jgi:AAA+ ATPase superfamily predicted ATPase
MVLVLDEFPALVSRAREVPSLLQKHIDRYAGRRVHLILAGSSQRMMQGLVLDRSAPLFGRATEILKISPLPAAWIGKALELSDPAQSVEAYAAGEAFPGTGSWRETIGTLQALCGNWSSARSDLSMRSRPGSCSTTFARRLRPHRS